MLHGHAANRSDVMSDRAYGTAMLAVIGSTTNESSEQI